MAKRQTGKLNEKNCGKKNGEPNKGKRIASGGKLPCFLMWSNQYPHPYMLILVFKFFIFYFPLA